jgi:hypothetical protein
MPYRFTQLRQDYSDFATGKVLHSFPGRTAFPVRLACEIFQRCVAIVTDRGARGPYVLYDPCCGSAALLSTLAYLYWDALDQLIGSDIDAEALLLAERNFALLTLEGIDERIVNIQEMLALYGKESHRDALISATHLRQRLLEFTRTHTVSTRLFLADATNGADILQQLSDIKVDMVITDIPYENSSAWQVSDVRQAPSLNPAWYMLESLLPVLSPCSVVAIATNKQQKITHEGYRRVDHFQIGKRRVVFLAPISPHH